MPEGINVIIQLPFERRRPPQLQPGACDVFGNGDLMLTTPNTFNSTLTEKNKATNSRLKPAVRLAKIWNADRGYPFASYPMERQAAGLSYSGCEDTVMSHFFRMMDSLALPPGSAQWKTDRLTRAREIISNTRHYIRAGQDGLAEIEVKKLMSQLRS